MEQKLIYRIEDAEGWGPFQGLPAWGSGPELIDWDTYNENPWDYPSPANDPGLGDERLMPVYKAVRDGDDLWAVGCCSPEQLQHWFDERVCRILAEHGYYFATYLAPTDKIVEGEFQALFNRAYAECVERGPASSLWPQGTSIGALAA